MAVSRRTFLKLAGAATAAAAFGTTFRPKLNTLVEAAPAQAGGERWIAGGCNGCVGWCPLEVRVVNGRAVKIRGNSHSKWTHGQICPRGHLNLQILYDPDRVKTPLKRTNPNKGRDQDPKWVPISWDGALGTIAAKMKELRDKGTPERVALLRGRYDAAGANLLYSRLPKAYGTPNSFSHSALCAETTKYGLYMAIADKDYSGYDFENTSYILSFGVAFLEAHRPNTGMLAAWGIARGEGRSRVKCVVVDPRCSVTAAKADEWIPINPGTDGALACAMAHAILTDGLWDKKFVGDFDKNSPVQKFEAGKTIPDEFTAEVEEEVEDPVTKTKTKEKKTVKGPPFKDASTAGLVKWWNVYLKDFTPEIAADITGIPAATIKRLAKEFAKIKPAVTVRGRGSEAWSGGTGIYNSYSIYALNGLVGSVEMKGGINGRASVSYSAEPTKVEEDDAAKAGNAKKKIDESKTLKFPDAGVVTNNVADSILKDSPYPIEMIIAYWSNFAFSAPGSKRWEEVFKKVPFMVHHTTHISETSMYADIILPAKTYLEKWAYEHPAGASNLYKGATLFQPVVEPLYDCMSEAEFAIALGKKLGEYYPSIKKSFDGIGGKHGDTAEGYVRTMTEAQWKTLAGGWDEFKEKGCTNVAYKFKTEWATPSKKLEFYSGTFKKDVIEKNKITDKELESYKVKARGDLLYVPHYEEPVFIGDAAKYPLSLITYKPALNQEGRSANSPWCQENLLPLLGIGWQNVAEINPATAAKHGIKHGDWIYVESEIGRIKVRAALFEGIHPSVVVMAYGQGHWAYGKVAKDRGANPNEITAVDYDNFTGMAAYYNTRVKVSKA